MLLATSRMLCLTPLFLKHNKKMIL